MNPFTRIGFAFLLLVICRHAVAQNQPHILPVESFIEQVRQFHPVAKQANLVVEKAAANLLTAKGSFDPRFQLNADRKTLDGTNYYQYNNPEIKIPTPIGINVKAGFEKSNGQYINPELTKGIASYMGIEIPLLNGLLIDKKRAGLQQAKIYENQSKQERLAMINDLLFDAYMAYWQWAGSYQLYKTYNNYVNVSANRVRLIRLSFLNGDRAMMDTIEAYAQLQSFQLMQTEALLELKNRALDLSQFLWTEEANPYLIPDSYIPDTTQFEMQIPIKDIKELSAQLLQTHPELRGYQYKLESLEVARKLKFQNLLPVVNLRANLLSKDYFNYKGFNAAYLENNYKLGVTIEMPLLLRQGRGEYKNAQIKIQEVNLQRIDKLWQLTNKVSQYYNEARLRQEQILVALSMFQNYNLLLKNEELKFSQGESTLFVINSRENKALEMQQKLIELRIKYLKSVYAIDWSSGVIQ